MRFRDIKFQTLVFALLAVGAGTAWADIPLVEPGVYIQDGASDLRVGLYCAPTVTDWNNDGKKDLVIGQELGGGNVQLFLNQGTDLNPIFNGGVKIESNGVPITMSCS